MFVIGFTYTHNCCYNWNW